MSGTAKADGLERRMLWGLWAFSAAAVAGFASVGQNPALLAGMPASSVRFYQVSFHFFAQAQIALTGLVLGVFLVRRAGLRWLPAFGLVYGVSLASELAGTTWGIPFGGYAYSSLLGVQWLDRVPVLIPLSWFAMALPSYALARAVHPTSALTRIALGSFVLLSWDLALDPAMSGATRYWIWAESGPYYGMPLLNLFGWYVTGVVLMAVLSWRDDGWVARLPLSWLLGFYGASLVLAMGMCAAAGLWGAVLATSVAIGGCAWWVQARVRAASAHRVVDALALEPTP